MPRPQNMKDGFARGKQIVGDDPAVAAPPKGLGAHECASFLAAQLPQLCKAAPERFGHRVIRIVVKALVRPERIYVRRNVSALSPQTPKRGCAVISNLMVPQSLRERFGIELRVPPRSRNCPNVDQKLNARFTQQLDEFCDWPGRMAYGEEWMRHLEMSFG